MRTLEKLAIREILAIKTGPTVNYVQIKSGLGTNSPNTVVGLLHSMFTTYNMYRSKVTKLPVLFQPYLLQAMYVTFQYLTVSCIPATGGVPNISRYGTFVDISW